MDSLQLGLVLVIISATVAKETYIIGGKDVWWPGKWPWQGSMRKNGGHICGISLISSTWGLTAAHCVHGQSTETLSFMFGSNDRFDNTHVVKAKQVIQHEDYVNGGGFPNDIAVVEFNGAVQGDFIQIVPLTIKGRDHAGNTDCYITGWGFYLIGASLPRSLKEAKMNVFTNADCRTHWGDVINDGHVCVRDRANGRISCQGDSGGPLVCKVDGRYELVGATSWGESRCSPEYPAAYTRIAYFRDWIKAKTGI